MSTGANEAIEAASAAAQKTPNRVSLADVEANIAGEFTFIVGDAYENELGFAPTTNDASVAGALNLLTVCVIVLKNGFSVMGKTAPADANNFDATLGRKFAREDAIRQIWPLMGYALREKLASL